MILQPVSALVNPGVEKPSECEHCKEGKGGDTAATASFDWRMDVGLTRYTASNNYLDYARTGVAEGTRHGALPRNLNTVFNYFNGGGVSNRQQLRLELSSAVINADLRDPASLTCNLHSSAEVIEINGFINQVLTDDALTHVDKLTDGFVIRMWSRSLITLGSKVNGLYPVPALATDTTYQAKITFEKPSSGTDSELLITKVEKFGSSSHTYTRHYKEVISATTSKPETLTVKTYDGAGTGGTLLKIEELTYSNRGAKVWDYHIERKIWTAHTSALGVVTAPTQTSTFLTRHDYEKYKDFSTSTQGGGKGARRQISNVSGHGVVGVGETVFDYVDNPTNAHVHGRLKSITRPDGSWEYYEYTGLTMGLGFFADEIQLMDECDHGQPSRCP